MNLSNLLPYLILLGSGIIYFWPRISQLIPEGTPFLPSDPEAPPHKEMSTIIDFFVVRDHKPGIDSAMTTGKLIYDAMATKPIPTLSKRKAKHK